MAVSVKPINVQAIHFSIRGTSPIIQHKWSEKARKQIRDKKLGKKTKDREVLDADAEYHAAMHMTDNGEYGIPIMAFKKSIINAAHKDLGVEKTLVRKSFFVPCSDSNMVVKMECDDPIMREDYVKVGMSGTDLRYRPEFRNWRVAITAEIDGDMLQVEDIVALVNRAGFGVGLCEMRPEKGGEYGRYEIDPTVEIIVEQKQ